MLDEVRNTGFQLPKATDISLLTREQNAIAALPKESRLDQIEKNNILNNAAKEAQKNSAELSISLNDLEKAQNGAAFSAGKLGTALKTAATNIGIMIGVSLAIQGAIWVFDQINVTLEEQQEIVDDLSKEIESLQTEYDALNSLKNRTGSQDVRLRTLRTELDLLEKQYQKELDLLALNELEGEGDFFSNGVLDNISNSGTVNESISQSDSLKVFENNFRRDAENLQKALNNYETALLDSGKEVFGEQVLNYRDAILDTLSDVEAKYLDLSEKRDAIQKHLDAGAFKNDTSKFTYYTNLLEDYGVQLQDADNLITEIKGILESSAHSALVEKFGQTAVGTLSSEQLAIAYQLDIDDISNFQDLIVAIENYNKQAREADESAKSMSSMIASLEALSDGFDGIKGIYEDVQNMDDFDFNSLISEDFTDIFGKYTVAYDNFVETVANSPKDINACRNAFNDLVTEWFYGQDALQNITDDTYAATVAWLQQEGVVNAVEVAYHALVRAKLKEIEAGGDYANMTAEEIAKTLELNYGISLTPDLLQALTIAKQTANGTHLDFTSDIKGLIEFGEKIGSSIVMLKQYNEMKKLQEAGAPVHAYSGMGDLQKQAEAEVQEMLNSAFDIDVDYSPISTSSGGSSDPFSVEIDKYEKYTRVIEDLSSTLSDLDRAYEHTDDIEERIALKNKEIALYHQQVAAIEDLNNARDEEIGANVDSLRAKGFIIDYDRLTDSLAIHNKELVNNLNLSDEQKEEIWGTIEATEELNDANKESTEQWKDVSYSILEARDALQELHEERFDEAISDAEHVIELYAKRADVTDEDLQLMKGIMTSLEKELRDIQDGNIEATKKRIKELQKMWMDYYDSILEREQELLEAQLEDRDSVLSAIDNLFNERIEAIDEEIESLQKINEEHKTALELQKAQAALDEAKSQKTRRVLRQGVGWLYEADEDAIKEAEETLADLEYEKTIETLEKQKEALEELQNKWAEIPDEFEKYQNALIAEELLGADWERDILDDRIDVFEDFKDDYFDIQEQIYEKTQELNEHMSEEYQEMMDMFAQMIAQFNTSEVSANATTNAGTRYWYVGEDGKAPAEADVGDVVYTKGGTYRIDVKDENGKFTSTKIDNTSTNIPEGLWGTEIKNGTLDLTDAVGASVLTTQDMISKAEDVNERIKQNILESDELQNYLKNNTDITQADIDAIVDNIDYMDVLSGNTGDNTDATDDNTRELRNLIYELANFEFSALSGEDQELVYSSALEQALENFDDSLMSPEDQAYLKQIQEAWNVAHENNNQYLMDELHALADSIREQYINGTLRTTVDGYDYNRVGADGYSTVYHENSRSDAYGGTNVAGIIGTTKSIWGLDASDGQQVLDYIERGLLTEEEAKSLVQLSGGKYNSDGSKKVIGNDGTDYSTWKSETVGEKHETSSGEGYWQTTKYTDPDTGKTVTRTDYTSYAQEEANKQWAEMRNASNKNSTVVDENTDAQYGVVDASYDLIDSNNESIDATNNLTDQMKEGIPVDVNVTGMTNAQTTSSWGSKKSSSNSLGTAVGGKENIGKSGGVTSSLGGGYSATRYSDGSVTIYKKAKGGTNLRGSIYNVDEKGPEMIIEPDEGRFVRISQGGNVIPADVTQRLWDFGLNPKSFVEDIVRQNLSKMNNIALNMTPATAGGTTNYYSIANVTLPNVTQPHEFWDSLMANIHNEAAQWVSKRH